MTVSRDPTPAPADEPTGSNATSPIEILAQFARSASRDAPQGTLIVDGHPPLRFAGWLDLMAIVEQILEAERQRDAAAAPEGAADSPNALPPKD